MILKPVRSRLRIHRATSFALSALLVAGCHSFGPDELKGTHPLYNEAINSSINEQFVQNLVRLHYHDPTFFLDVTNVAATLKLELSGGLDQSTVGLSGSADNILKFSAGGAYTTQPTISYSPLQGESFVKSLLNPIAIESILELTYSGWSERRVYGLCVERINDLENVPSGSGPKPDEAPEHSGDFARFLELVQKVRGSRLITPHIDPVTKQAIVQIHSNARHQGDIAEIKHLLGLDPHRETYILTGNVLQRGGDTISISTRSLMSIFFYLSHNIETPTEHKQEGLIKITRNKDGSVFDWATTPAGQLFRINVSESKPDHGFLAIPYRDHWFYVRDNDLESKSTFMLLTQLFRLQAGASKAAPPTLTIPVR
ncbi:MAG: hypothetical protein ACK443_10685 [Methylococcaceae bacterium]